MPHSNLPDTLPVLPAQSPHAPVLAVRGLTKRFQIHALGKTVTAFRDLDFEARPGRFTGLVGASGSGKSSVLKCLYRVYRTTAGEILYRTQGGVVLDLAGTDDQEILDLRRTEIRFVSQFLHTLPRQSTRAVVAAPLVENGLSIEESDARALALLERIGVPRALWDLPPLTFSGGERQLVNMARALVVRPRLLLLDEPTASLDPTSTQRIVAEIERLKSEAVAMVGVFHDRALMSRLADDRVDMPGGINWQTEP